jgi:hypothetical protein
MISTTVTWYGLCALQTRSPHCGPLLRVICAATGPQVPPRDPRPMLRAAPLSLALQALLVLAAAPAQFAVQHPQPCIDDKPSDPLVPLQLYTQSIHHCVEYVHIIYIHVYT